MVLSFQIILCSATALVVRSTSTTGYEVCEGWVAGTGVCLHEREQGSIGAYLVPLSLGANACLCAYLDFFDIARPWKDGAVYDWKNS